MKKWLKRIAWGAVGLALAWALTGCCSVAQWPWCDEDPDPDPIPTNAPPAVGACVLLDSGCVVTTALACANVLGQYLGDGEICPQPEPPPTNAPVEILAFMQTDVFADKDSDRVQAKLEALKGHYTDIYGVVSITIPEANRFNPLRWLKVLRPYTVPTREADGRPSPLFYARYRQVVTNGFRVGLAIDNHPSVRNGEGQYMVPPCRTEAELFSAIRLEGNKLFLADVLAWCEREGLPQPYFIAPILEPTDSRARQREGQLVDYGRSLGYTGWWIMTSPGNYWRDPARKVLSAGSTGSWQAWQASKCDVRSSDGDQNVSLPVSVTQRVCAPGPMGAIIWIKAAIGDANGPGTILPWMTEGVPCVSQ